MDVFRDWIGSRVAAQRAKLRKVDAPMLMERFDGESKPLVCGQPVDRLGIRRFPDPTKVLLRYRGGAEVECDFIGWDVVYAWIATDGLWALRDGHRVILTDSHWGQQLWGRA